MAKLPLTGMLVPGSANMKKVITLLCSIIIVAQSKSQQSYAQEIAVWKKERLTELKSENGWLNLAGLIWIEEGKHSFGSAKTAAIRLPIPQLPAIAGSIERKGHVVTQVLETKTALTVDGKSVPRTIIFYGDSAGQPAIVLGTYQWKLIQREDKIGIRLRNLSHPAIKELKKIPCYPADTMWRIKAKLIPALINTQVAVQNVLGQTTMQLSPGKLSFQINGHSFLIDALQEGDQLFIVFGDATSGKTTYPAGRFLYASMPGEDGLTVLDFNKAFNPPCAFTPYATCPLPPKQNMLSIAIPAGEKKAGKH